jgi:hypothetical protein
MMGTWGETFDFLADITADTIGFLIDLSYDLTEFLAGVFTADWKRAWAGISGAFKDSGSYMTKIAENLLAMFGLTFGDIGKICTDIWSGIKSTIKNSVNSIIGFINSMISGIVTGMNTVIRALNRIKVNVPSWVPVLGGKTFGFNLSQLSTPKIPYLAKGAVLPANKPFLAMVGDQKHGTNVEAPLETIQEAVALVMEDYVASNLAGQEAILAVLKDILEAVLGIEIGDDVIGQAVARYNRKVAIMRGGA